MKSLFRIAPAFCSSMDVNCPSDSRPAMTASRRSIQITGETQRDVVATNANLIGAMILQHLKGHRISTVFLFRVSRRNGSTGMRRVFSALFVVEIALPVSIRPLATRRAGPKLQGAKR